MSASPTGRLRLFEGWGIELEYMIVDRATLDVKPISDELLRAAAGELVSDYDDEGGAISWSNELALHVIELKTNGPAAALGGLPRAFAASLGHVERLLEPLGATLLPGAMHPWMDPHREMRLWPHDNEVIYGAFNRIFDCRGHGWANLQSMHVNLPFGDDERADGEFARLHAAIRLVLPILPALAASSPVVEGRVTGKADTRLAVYRDNARRVPSVAGRIVPEPVFTRADYEREILGRIYADMAPLDPEGLLRHEWCNSRGAIARFDRNAIEIRVLDVQECPRADLAIASLVGALVENLVRERWAPLARQQSVPVEPLAQQLDLCITQAERAPVLHADYLALFGLQGGDWSVGRLWGWLAGEVLPAGDPRRAEFGACLDTILGEGPLARRLLGALGPEPSRERLREVYGRLAGCLLGDRMFHGS